MVAPAAALGFLMFCVGINTKVEQFQQVAREPQVSRCSPVYCAARWSQQRRAALFHAVILRGC